MAAAIMVSPPDVGRKHEQDDSRIGQPLCPSCYDYCGAVLFNAHAGDLWRRTTVYLRAELAKQAGLCRKRFAQQARLSYVKVAEFQARGLVHFHAVIRLDGPEGPSTPAPVWADTDLITAAVLAVIPRVTVRCPGSDGEPDRVFGWGEQLDIRTITPEDGEERLSEQVVSAYIAKYAAKAAEGTGTVDRRIRSMEQRASGHSARPGHDRNRLDTRRRVGVSEPEARPWAHMLGYRGHFSTKSRAYSTTLGALRQARADYRAEQRAAQHGLPAPEQAVPVGTYAGRGYATEGHALIADDVRTIRREVRASKQQATA
jgi:hypothetical protein